MNNIYVKIIPQLKDNYSFLIYNNKNSLAIIVDPAEAKNHNKFLIKNNLNLKSIFLTHHHSDHTSGVKDLLKLFPEILVYSPNNLIEGTTHLIKNNNLISNPVNKFKVIGAPGHTLDHIMLYDEENALLFCGDVLFRLGCGRVFEGTFEQMYNSVNKINKFPNDTLVYCGHEYTISNLLFLEKAFQKLNIFKDERKKIEMEIKKTSKTIPFYLGHEKEINPFLNQKSAFFSEYKKNNKLSDFEMFKLLREKKDQF